MAADRPEIQAAAARFRSLGADVSAVETDLATTGVDRLWAAAAGRPRRPRWLPTSNGNWLGPLRVINTGAHRPNLSYHVRPVSSDADKQRQLVDIVRSGAGSTIVYAATVRHVEALHALFRAEGLLASSYHGRQRAQDREEAQDTFMTGAVPIIIVTNAFGMGIDKPDIRTVVHYDLPASLDVYSQESGRAGRDNEPADCILLFQRRDRGLQRFSMAGRYPTHDDFMTLVEGLRPASGAGQ